MVVEKGNNIKVEYEGKFEDGTIFDSSAKHGKPLEFEAGKGMVVKGFDNAVLGMKKGEEKEITIAPEEAYGLVRADLEKKIPKEQVPDSDKVKAGMTLGMQLPNGQAMPVKVKEVTEKEIVLDLNHPLAGKTLIFKIKIIDIIK